MSPSAFFQHRGSWGERHDEHSAAWSWVIAILFAVVAATSFAVDQTVTLSSLPAPAHSAGR